jgi:hypothetical protein
MAIRPNKSRQHQDDAVVETERFVDEAIRRAAGPRVFVPVAGLRIGPAEWDRVLKPKYRAAGWMKAAWVTDREGDYLDLDLRA